MRHLCLSLVLALGLCPAASRASGAEGICAAIAQAARETALAPAFLTRVLRQEPDFPEATAIVPTARTLARLTADYGNPGLAALAFAGGHIEAETLLRGEGIAMRSRDFVIETTGLTPEAWRDAAPEAPAFRLSGAGDFAANCAELVAGSWGAPLPVLSALPLPPVLVEPVRIDPSRRSLRPKLRPTPKLAQWGAQLAFGKSRAQARANFDRATRACRQAVGQAPDIIHVENRVRGRPGYWMARVSRMERSAAEDICRAARARGCTCVVYKNY
ncbi:MAG: hypothetical protein EP318_03770 [Rhodobacteraceae bacterium]|nr:MAG: hypothetical protein EP318_03770 [Paracoccaceae bacterium]